MVGIRSCVYHLLVWLVNHNGTHQDFRIWGECCGYDKIRQVAHKKTWHKSIPSSRSPLNFNCLKTILLILHFCHRDILDFGAHQRGVVGRDGSCVQCSRATCEGKNHLKGGMLSLCCMVPFGFLMLPVQAVILSVCASKYVVSVWAYSLFFFLWAS